METRKFKFKCPHCQRETPAVVVTVGEVSRHITQSVLVSDHRFDTESIPTVQSSLLPTKGTRPPTPSKVSKRVSSARHRKGTPRRTRHQKLTNLREARGWSVEELARRAGLHFTAVHRIETGEVRNPRPETLEKLALALNVGASDLAARFSRSRDRDHSRPTGKVFQPHYRLTQLRELKGFSRKDLAVKAGVDASGITRIERGENIYPKDTTLSKIAAALGVTLDDLKVRAKVTKLVPGVTGRSVATAAAPSRS